LKIKSLKGTRTRGYTRILFTHGLYIFLKRFNMINEKKQRRNKICFQILADNLWLPIKKKKNILNTKPRGKRSNGTAEFIIIFGSASTRM